VLLRRHYRAQRMPGVLDDRFIQLLRHNNTFDRFVNPPQVTGL
jgi:hypothetical protein